MVGGLILSKGERVLDLEAPQDMNSSVRIVAIRRAGGEPNRPARTNSVVVLADGLNYRDERGTWQKTEARFEATDAGFVARRGPHKLLLKATLDNDAVQATTPDGVTLKSCPLSLGYFDPSTGDSVVLSTSEWVAAVLISSNQVAYPDAFLFPRASVVFTYERGGCRQDIVLHEAPPPPGDYGLPAGSRLEVLTEFHPDTQPPRKEVTPRAIAPLPPGTPEAAAPVLDETLHWGDAMHMTLGHAFLRSAGPVDSAPRVPVSKTFHTIDNRHILSESVEHYLLVPLLDGLPKPRAAQDNPPASKTVRALAHASGRSFPLPQARTRSAELSGAIARVGQLGKSVWDGPGLVLDYDLILSGSCNNYTFTNGTTYLIVGPTTLNGSTAFEGGCILKYQKDVSAKLTVVGPVTFATDSYLPAVFTAEDDDSVGAFVTFDIIDPHNAYYADPALELRRPDTTIENIRISHAKKGIVYACDLTQPTTGHALRHAQFYHCDRGLVGSGQYYSGAVFWKDIYAGNLLMSQVNIPVSGQYYRLTAEQATIDQATAFIEGTAPQAGYCLATFRNSIIANVPVLYGSGGASVYVSASSTNGFHAVPTAAQFGYARVIGEGSSPFTVAGSGEHYLRADSGFRSKGAPGIQAVTKAALATRTTQMPAVLQFPMFIERDTLWTPWVTRGTSGTPDLGYHYPVVDYLTSFLIIYRARVRAAAGTVIATDPRWFLDAASHWFGGVGIGVIDDGSFELAGTPSSPIRVVGADVVHEATNLEAAELRYDGTLPSIVLDGVTPSSRLEARFAEFTILGGYDCYSLGVGCDLDFYNGSGVFSEIQLRDCRFRGGRLTLSPGGNPEPGSILLQNTLFESVELTAWADGTSSFTMRNCLQRGGRTDLYAPPTESWVVTDNLFDWSHVYSNEADTHDYNAYYLPPGGLALQPPGGHDVPLTVAPAYEPGQLGGYYLPATSPTHNAGSQVAADVGLAQYTTLANQTLDGSESTPPDRVDIGFHYVVIVDDLLQDSDYDSIPDVFEDENGNGLADDTTSWNDCDSDDNNIADGEEDSDADGVTDALELALGTDRFNGDEDWDQDGNSNVLEKILQTNPLLADSPISAVAMTPSGPVLGGMVTMSVQLPVNWGALSLKLICDGEPLADLLPVEVANGGVASFAVNTEGLPNGNHVIRAEAILTRDDPNWTTPSLTALGPVVRVGVSNAITFGRILDPSGTMEVLPEWSDSFAVSPRITAFLITHPAECVITILDSNGSVIRTLDPVSSSDGIVDLYWDMLTDGNEIWSGGDGDHIQVTMTSYSPDLASQGQPGSTQSQPSVPRKQKYSALAANWPLEGNWIFAGQSLNTSASGATMDTWLDSTVYAWDNGAHPPSLPYGPGIGRQFARPFRLSVVPPAIIAGPADVVAEWTLLRQALGEDAARNLWYVGHGSQQLIGGDLDLGTGGGISKTPSGAWLHTYLSMNDVSGVLGYWNWFVSNHPYRFVFLEGCDTATKRGYAEWASYFGVRTRPEADILKYCVFSEGRLKLNRLPSAFCGFSGKIYRDNKLKAWHDEFRRAWISEGLGLNVAGERAAIAAQSVLGKEDPGTIFEITGFTRLRISEFNTRDAIQEFGL